MPIKTLILASFLVGVSPLLFAQNSAPAIEWQRCFGSSETESAASTIATSDGGYIFIGASSTFQDPQNYDGDLRGMPYRGNIDTWIVKLSSTRTIQWQKRIGGSGKDYLSSIAQTRDGGYILAGTTTSSDSDFSDYHDGTDIWLVKLSSIGDIQWQKCLGGSGQDYGNSVIQTADNGYLIGGSTSYRDGDVTNPINGFTDAWVIKLSAIGTIEWQKCLGGSSVEEFTSVIQTNDGSYVLTGNTNSNDGDVSGNHGDKDIWVVKLSKTGMLQWQKCLGGSWTEINPKIIQTSDSGYAIIGTTDSDDGNVGNFHGGTDIWVAKLSKLGVLQWQKCLGGSGYEIASSIQQTSDLGYIIGGNTTFQDGDVGNIRGGSDAWVVKLSPQGVLQWQKTLGGTITESLSAVIQTLDGGYLATGNTTSNDFDVMGNHGSQDIWLVKLGKDVIKALIGQVEQTNTQCQQWAPPQYIGNSEVKIEKNSTFFYVSTDSFGRFETYVDTGIYKLSVVLPSNLWGSCPPKIVVVANQNVNDTTVINPNIFANAICPLMEVQLTTPFLRRCFESTYTINYANRGTAIQNDATAELTLDSALTFVSATRPVRSRVGNKVIFSLGNVGINQTGQFTVDVKVSCDSRLGQTHCSSVIIPKTMTCDTVQDSIPTIVNQCVAGCDSILFLVNKPNTTLNKTFKYQLIADAALIDTGRFILSNSFNLKRKRDGRTYRLEVRNPTTNQLLVARSVESNPIVSTPSVSTGFVNQFSNAVKQSNISENCTANRGAFDPNDKAAVPIGIGTAHLIEQGKEIDYLIRFQNTGTDTAFKVVVKDTFSAHFNLSTFKLNATSHVATWQLNPKGILIVTFNNIYLVDSFTNEKKSHGFFKYTIKLNDSIATNTIVTNKAGIYFDFNAPIITNLTSHTIGKELLKNCLIKPTIAVNYSGCPSRNIVFTATAKSAGLNPTYAWFRNNETTPLSINAVFTLNNAVRGTKIYCKTTASSDICTETPVITSDTIVLNCIGVPTTDLNSIVQLFDVFPNPNKGVFTVKLNTIKSEKIQLNILNYLGQTIKSALINANNYAEEFNLSTLPTGIYLIKLTINGQSLSKKISVQ